MTGARPIQERTGRERASDGVINLRRQQVIGAAAAHDEDSQSGAVVALLGGDLQVVGSDPTRLLDLVGAVDLDGDGRAEVMVADADDVVVTYTLRGVRWEPVSRWACPAAAPAR